MNKISMWVMLILFGLPMIVSIALQFMSAAMLATMFSSFNGPTYEDDMKAHQIEGLDKVLNTSTGGRGAKMGFKALAKFKDINASRSIEFSAIIDPSSLLNSDEELPEKDFMDVFVQARSVNYGREECKRLSEVITSECVVRTSNINRLSDGRYNLHFYLRFVQLSEFGSVDTSEQVSFQEITERFSNVDVRNGDTGKQAEAERMSLYKKVREHCDLLKERQGNCAINRIKITSSRVRTSAHMVTFTANATYSMLQGGSNFSASSGGTKVN